MLSETKFANPKTIMVTGAAGFLGSHLCDALLSRGHRVIAVDNLSQGKRENLSQAMQNERFSFHLVDITDAAALNAVSEGVDVIAHLAAYKIPRYGNRLKTVRDNSLGSINVLDVAARNNAKFVMTSTSDVYGMNPDIPFSETSNSVIGASTVGRWAYAVSKLLDEHLAFGFQEDHGIPVTVLRIFGSYGPRHHLSWWGGPQSVFIDAILRNEKIPIHGDGLQTRSFTFVSDTIAGIVAALENENANNQIINIGSTHEISIVDLASTIHRLIETPEPLRLEFVPYAQISGREYQDVRRRVPDISKAQELLGFKAQVSLVDGLRRTIEWQKSVSALPEKIAVGV